MARSERWRAVAFCHDCTDYDPLGCFEGGEQEIGVYDTKGEADRAGAEYTNGCSPWDYRVEVVEENPDGE